MSVQLTQDRLKTLLRFDPKTGIFSWLRNMKGGKRAGDVAGYHNWNGNGYIMVRVDAKLYTAHRLAWFYMTGEWPANDIDHVDRDKTNNKWSNLRAATRAQNVANSAIPKHNSSGVKGVSFASRDKYWHSYLEYNGKRITLGYFKEFDEAVAARRVAEGVYLGEFCPLTR